MTEETSHQQQDRQRRQNEESIRLARTQVQVSAEQQIAANAAQNAETSAVAAARAVEMVNAARTRKPEKKLERKFSK